MKDKTKSVMGRPKKANPANKQLPRIRVTEDQLKAYRVASKRSGKNLSEWVRNLLDKASKEE